MKRVILIVLGVILLLVSVPAVIGGVVFAAIGSGDDPNVEGRIGQVDSSGYAVVSDTLEVHWDYPFADRFDLAVGARNTGADTPVFIGYAPASAVDAYLSGVPQTLVYDLGDESRSQREVEIPGSAVPPPPGEQDFWIEQGSGTGLQEIPLASPSGSYRIVVMNADGSQGLAVDVYGSMTLPFLLPVGIGLLVIGLLLLTLSVVLIVWGIRSKPTPAAAAAPQWYPPPPDTSYPPGPGQYSPPGPYPGVSPGRPVGPAPPSDTGALDSAGPGTGPPTASANPPPSGGKGEAPSG